MMWVMLIVAIINSSPVVTSVDFAGRSECERARNWVRHELDSERLSAKVECFPKDHYYGQ